MKFAITSMQSQPSNPPRRKRKGGGGRKGGRDKKINHRDDANQLGGDPAGGVGVGSESAPSVAKVLTPKLTKVRRNSPTSPVFANADTGSTGNFIALSDAHAILDVQPTSHPVRAMLPDGSIAVSTHSGQLNLPSLPAEARRVDIFPNWVGSLLSIGLLCDNGLLASYTDTTVTISSKSGDTILMCHRCPITKV